MVSLHFIWGLSKYNQVKLSEYTGFGVLPRLQLHVPKSSTLSVQTSSSTSTGQLRGVWDKASKVASLVLRLHLFKDRQK